MRTNEYIILSKNNTLGEHLNLWPVFVKTWDFAMIEYFKKWILEQTYEVEHKLKSFKEKQ